MVKGILGEVTCEGAPHESVRANPIYKTEFGGKKRRGCSRGKESWRLCTKYSSCIRSSRADKKTLRSKGGEILKSLRGSTKVSFVDQFGVVVGTLSLPTDGSEGYTFYQRGGNIGRPQRKERNRG